MTKRLKGSVITIHAIQEQQKCRLAMLSHIIECYMLQ